MANNPLIADVMHLKHCPRAAEAGALMQDLATLVYPVMKHYNWKLRLLEEFYPTDDYKGILLGLNTSKKKIQIRLRSHLDLDVFLPRELVIWTLLHELSHMEVMVHNEKFDKTYSDVCDFYRSCILDDPQSFCIPWPEAVKKRKDVEARSKEPMRRPRENSMRDSDLERRIRRMELDAPVPGFVWKRSRKIRMHPPFV
ncbi:hypothetical protein KEM55_006582, partial [Ascosphaera atra]